MPNAVDNFSNFCAQFRRNPPAPTPVAPAVAPPPTYNPYASTYVPSTPVAPPYSPHNAPGPLSSTLGSLKGVVNNKDYNDFVDQKAPIIDKLLPLVGGLVGFFTGDKTTASQPVPTATTPQPTPPAYPQPTPPAYPQPTYPTYQTYPQQTYPQPTYPQAVPAGQGDWTVQVNQGLQGIQGLVGLVSTIGGLFK